MVSILIFTDLGDQIMNKYLYTIILNIVYKYKSTYVILQNKIIKVEIIALKMQFYKILWLWSKHSVNQHELSVEKKLQLWWF